MAASYQEMLSRLRHAARGWGERLRPPSGGRERFYLAGHALVQVALMLIIFFQANLLGCRKSSRADLTRDGKFTLSSTTTNYLHGLGKDVQVVSALMRGSEFFNDVRGLLTEYQRHGQPHLRVETLDLARDRERLALLASQKGLRFDREVLVVTAADRLRVIPAEDLVRRDPADKRIVEFRGEEVLTSAILEVTESQQRRLYLLGGKRRMEELALVAQQFASLAASQNARVEALSLEGRDALPEDADALILPGITEDLTKREIDLITQAWQERHVGLMVLLDTTADTPNLGAFLRAQGVNPRKDRVLTTTTLPGLPPQVTYKVPAVFIPGSPITRDLAGMTTSFDGQSRSLEVFSEDPVLQADNVRPQALAYADGRYWGETDYLEEPFVFDSKQDHPGPLALAAAVERGQIGDPDLLEGSSRLVVVANSGLIDPQGNTSKVNADFVMAGLNWTLNRASLSGISPRQSSAYTLQITPPQSALLQTLSLFILPGLFLLGGLVVWVRRRA